jgi:hypothetical protein
VRNSPSGGAAAVSTTDTTNMNLSFPWKIKYFSGSFDFTRVWSSSLNAAAIDIEGDLTNYYSSFNRAKNHLFSIPFNSLFDSALAKLPFEQNTTTESFSDRSRFVLNLPHGAGVSQLVVPRSFETSLERKINRRYDTESDSLRSDILSRWTAINLFGASGTRSLFKFYRDDEFNNMLSLLLEFPKQEDVKWNLTLDQDLWFFGFRGSSLAFSDTLSFGPSGNTYTFTLRLSQFQDDNLVGKLYRYVTGRFSDSSFSPLLASFANAKLEHLQSENVTFTYNDTGTNPRGSFSLGHESRVRIAGRMSFSLFLNLDIADDRASGVTTFVGKTGTKLKLSF